LVPVDGCEQVLREAGMCAEMTSNTARMTRESNQPRKRN
jgi:hypothetical protein